jgi:hypothetical protein
VAGGAKDGEGPPAVNRHVYSRRPIKTFATLRL